MITAAPSRGLPVGPADVAVMVASAAGQQSSAVREAVIRMPACPERLGKIRRTARALLALWEVPEESRDDAEIIIAELAANAVLHGRAHVDVALSKNEALLRITVTDHGSPRTGLPQHRENDGECGRGLVMVSRLASGVAIDRRNIGWSVHASMRLANV